MEISKVEAADFGIVFANVQLTVHKTAVEHGWWDQPVREVGTAIALMHSEVSEALEAYRMDELMEMRDEKVPEHSAVAAELADVVIRIMDFAEYHDLNVGDALIDKANFNHNRPHRHGGKAC